MRVLLISPRAPQADGRGDAARAAAFIAALSRRHQVDVFVPRASNAARVRSAVWDLLSGRPAQIGFSMPGQAWAEALEAARQADVVVAITVRAVRGPVGVPLIVDHVDALSLNWALRARGPEGRARRLLARLEASRLRRWEHRVADWAAAQLVLSEQEVAALPELPPVVVVPLAVMISAPPEVSRDIDVVFTGNMWYPPNVEAAQWLDREITPALDALHPSARVVVAGRRADRLGLRNVETMSDVASISAVLARSRTAMVPLRGTGTGAPTKALEAAACGAALVVTPWVNERLPLPAAVAGDASGLAAEAAALLADEPARTRLAQRAQKALVPYSVERIGAQLLAVLESVVRSAP